MLTKEYNELIKKQMSEGELEEERVLPPLWDHQKKAIEKARHLDYFALFFSVGCGKSRTIIEILNDKYESHGRILRTLILTPLIVVPNFQREIERFGKLSRYKSKPLLGTYRQKISALKEGYPIVITNYEALQTKELYNALHNFNPEVVVLDELHKIKDPTSQRARNCQSFSDKAKYRYGLSGTPVLNSEMDLFSQIRFLDHGRALGSNFFAFRAQYFYDENASKPWLKFKSWRPRPNVLEEFKRKISYFTMSATRESALDLPDLITKELYLEMNEEQSRCYQSMKNNFIAYLKDKASTATLAITKALRLLQITSGFIKFEDGTEEHFSPHPKAVALEKLLEEITPHSKVIVWCTFKNNYKTVSEVCKKLNLNYSELHGETLNRQEEIDKFQLQENVRVMIANPSAGGIGINLTSASYMIYYSKNFNLADEIQSEARCYRAGSEIHSNIVRIDLICKNTIDSFIHDVLKDKRMLADSVLAQPLSKEEVLLRLKNHLGV